MEGMAMYSLDKFDFEPTDPTKSAFAGMELMDMLAIVLLVDVFGLSWYLNRNRSLKLAHITITYAMAYGLLLK
ncbi:uncharacterized protein ATC70_002807 [Mucor velutinosus]|uniref:Uncharacterized protein n=1 Tax=Mucor velutinosus TaxID=708070 RepID=A0AAN7I0L4_9FUNG|nr:hypothetical protein ATC70_002807 [Mucor velutinosus]